MPESAYRPEFSPAARHRLPGSLVLGCTAVLLLCQSGCGTGGAPASQVELGGRAPAPAPEPRLPGNPFTLPAPATLLGLLPKTRTASYTEDGLARSGSAYEDVLPHNRVNRAATLTAFAPIFTSSDSGLDHAAYALYSFAALDYDRDASLRLVWDTPPPSNSPLYCALANFSSNRWDWYQFGSSQLSLADLGPYIAGNGTVVAALVLLGTDSAVLASLRLGSLPPIPAATPDIALGAAPLTVTFDAGASADPDGAAGDLTDIKLFEWDFDADSSWDASSASESSAQYTYATSGSVAAALRITDADGATAVTSIPITVKAGPGASFTADPVEGYEPQDVDFDATASTDDGSIAKYEWDWDGDGTLDFDSGTDPTVAHTYTFGSYTVLLQVTDDEDYTGTAAQAITVNYSWMTPPTAALEFDQPLPKSPSPVDFDASGSTDDVSVDKFEWDWTTDGTYDLDSGTTATASHVYDSVGTHTATVRVTDNQGATDTAAVQITVTGYNAYPNPDLRATPQQGAAPLATMLDASGADGDNQDSELLFEWDLDNDGTFELNTSHTPTLQHTFSDPGGYKPWVRVTDPYGRSNSAFVEIGALSSGWSTSQIASNEYCWSMSAGLAKRPFYPNSVYVPAVAYQNNNVNVMDLHYLVARYPPAAGWEGPFTIPCSASGVYVSEFGDGCSLAYVSGRPAVAARAEYTNTSGQQKDAYFYIRADNQAGTSWTGTARKVSASASQFGSVSLAVVDGNPAVAYGSGGLKFLRASDTTGSSWPGTPVSVTNGSVYSPQALQVVSGKPAIVFNSSSGKLSFVRATDADGTAWGAVEELDATGTQQMLFALINGYPAVAYYVSSLGEIRYVSGQHVTGAPWTAPQTLCAGYQPSLVQVGSVPAISFFNNQNLYFKRALNSTGFGAWAATETVDVTGVLGSEGQAIVQNGLNILYQDYTNLTIKHTRN